MLSCIHKSSHNLKGIPSGEELGFVFSCKRKFPSVWKLWDADAHEFKRINNQKNPQLGASWASFNVVSVSCGKNCVGQTGRCVTDRMTEHLNSVRYFPFWTSRVPWTVTDAAAYRWLKRFDLWTVPTWGLVEATWSYKETKGHVRERAPGIKFTRATPISWTERQITMLPSSVERESLRFAGSCFSWFLFFLPVLRMSKLLDFMYAIWFFVFCVFLRLLICWWRLLGFPLLANFNCDSIGIPTCCFVLHNVFNVYYA